MHNNCTYSACFDGIWNITFISLLGGQPIRIISQDGTIDLPYEHFVISVNMQNQEEIIAWMGNYISDDECIVMAIYSSREKAEKAMKMLREKYKDYARATNKSNFYTMFDYPKVFQFPDDEEVV